VAALALCAVATVVAFAFTAPQQAHASFTISRCEGAAVQGEGSSLQKIAQLSDWIPHVYNSPAGCENGPKVSYEPDGSGCGIAAMGGGKSAEGKCLGFEAKNAEEKIRSKTTRFAGSDAPLTPAQKSAAQAEGTEQAGLIHQLPVASAAVAVVVHFPEGCKLKDPGTGVSSANGDTSTGGPNDPVGAATGDTYAAETLRVHITTEELEKIWVDGTQQTWGNVVPEADLETDGKATNPKTPAECAALPVIRIVRLDGSGTTYNFKAYLSLPKSAPTGLWTTGEVVGDNNKWPVAGKVEVPNKVVSNECKAISDVCTAEKTGGGGVASAVEGTNGSIGYLDLATAREKGFDITPNKDDKTYWIPVQTINPDTSPSTEGTNWVEPTSTATAHVNGGVGAGSTKGANCLKADYRNIPTTPASDPTLGDWSTAIATGSKDGTTYPVCAMTYDFAFDDDSKVYGNTLEEQQKAMTVLNYLEAVVSPFGQDNLEAYDYGTLPASIQKITQEGVKAIGWNKEAGSGGGPKVEPKTEPKTETPGGGGPPIVTPPSNAFSITGAKVKGKAIVLSLVLPGPGRVQIKATGGGVTVASVIAVVKAGNGSVTLSISKAALSKLAKIKGHKFGVKITVTFTPTGGTAAGKAKTIMLTRSAVLTKKTSKKGKK
jgi:ABC-type phosphate transport system substrate-binding protein